METSTGKTPVEPQDLPRERERELSPPATCCCAPAAPEPLAYLPVHGSNPWQPQMSGGYCSWLPVQMELKRRGRVPSRVCTTRAKPSGNALRWCSRVMGGKFCGMCGECSRGGSRIECSGEGFKAVCMGNGEGIGGCWVLSVYLGGCLNIEGGGERQ